MRNIDRPAEKIFFTSDTHFGHEWIINFNKRPYLSSDDMDYKLIQNWNSIVTTDGLTFILGDIGATDDERIVEIFNQLNGDKILIKGNHDNIYSEDALNSIFIEIHDMLYIGIDDEVASKKQDIVLCHYPLFDWNNFFGGSWHLFGHLHTRELAEFDTLKSKLFAQQYDVGIDNNDFRPISYYEVKEIIERQMQDNRFKQSNYY